MLDIKSNNPFLTKKEIKNISPSVFTKNGSCDTSEKYCHIPTEKIIDDMELLGWGVVDAKEVKARKTSNIGFQKHLLVFRNNDLKITSEDGDDVFPQILLTNSHDGKNSFVFTAGLFRLICENGLVISTQEFSSVKIRHYGYSFEELQKGINDMVENLPLTIESINNFKSIELGQQEMLEFAQKAIDIRFDQENTEGVDLQDLLYPTREEDKGTDLWSVYNTIQEKLIKGDFQIKSGSKSRKVRRIKNFKQDISLNEKLFELALSYSN